MQNNCWTKLCDPYPCVQIHTWALVSLQRLLWTWHTNSGGEVPGATLIHQGRGRPSRRGVWWGQTADWKALQSGAMYQRSRHPFRLWGPQGPLYPDRGTVHLELQGFHRLLSHMCCWWGFWNVCWQLKCLVLISLYPFSFHVQLFLVCVLCPGKQKAVVRCVNRKQSEEVDDSMCDSSSRPPVMIRMCDPEPCPPR